MTKRIDYNYKDLIKKSLNKGTIEVPNERSCEEVFRELEAKLQKEHKELRSTFCSDDLLVNVQRKNTKKVTPYQPGDH